MVGKGGGLWVGKGEGYRWENGRFMVRKGGGLWLGKGRGYGGVVGKREGKEGELRVAKA